MALSLPLIAEEKFSAYISGSLTGVYVRETADGMVSGQYDVTKGISIEPFTSPVILVSSLKYSETEPFTHVFEGSLNIFISTQIDDVENPVATHDSAVAEVYAAMSDQAAVFASVNSSNFHLWGYYLTNYENGIGQGEHGERAIGTSLEYRINCQNSGVA